jgi:hypothetical protein
MEPTRSLSPQQKEALEAVVTFLAAITPFLQSVEASQVTYLRQLPPEERLLAADLRDLAEVCKHRLTEAFPELLEWLREWERGGAS